MNPVKEYGKVDYDLTSLIEEVRSIPPSAWKYRNDPESYETMSLSSGSPHFPEQSVQGLLNQTEILFGKPGYTNRVLLSCIPAGKSILPHTDDFSVAIRSKSYHCHIPIITKPGIIMGFPDDGLEIYMEPGFLYSIDETRKHYVNNPTDLDRVHLLFAYFPHYGK